MIAQIRDATALPTATPIPNAQRERPLRIVQARHRPFGAGMRRGAAQVLQNFGGI